MKKVLTAILIVSIASLLSCSFGGPTGSSGDVIWPLALGNEWQGTATFYDSDGNVTNRQSMNFLVSGDTIIGNETWYFMSTYSDDEPVVSSSWLLANRDDGLHQILLPIVFREPTTGADENLWMKYPSKAGDSYLADNGETIVVESTDAHVFVPQGSRRCNVYEYLRPDGFARQYAAPGVGLVKIEVQVPYEVGPGAAKVAPGWIWELEKLILK